MPAIWRLIAGKILAHGDKNVGVNILNISTSCASDVLRYGLQAQSFSTGGAPWPRKVSEVRWNPNSLTPDTYLTILFGKHLAGEIEFGKCLHVCQHRLLGAV